MAKIKKNKSHLWFQMVSLQIVTIIVKTPSHGLHMPPSPYINSHPSIPRISYNLVIFLVLSKSWYTFSNLPPKCPKVVKKKLNKKK